MLALANKNMFGKGGCWGFVVLFRNSYLRSYNVVIGNMQQSFHIKTVEGLFL